MIERIKQVMNYYSLSVNAFASKIGSSQATINQQMNGDRKLSLETINKILSSFELISADWLIRGEGNMLVDRKEVNKSSHSSEGIPLIPLSAMAGAFMGEQQVLECECERYVIPAFQGADFLIHVKGDSMYPNYKSGDIVACRRVPMEKLFFQWNHTYVLDTDQGALIKRINKGIDQEHVLIVSDNSEYSSFELPVSCIYGVALVIGIIRLE